MVVHDLNLPARDAESIIMLKDGKIYANGKPEQEWAPFSASKRKLQIFLILNFFNFTIDFVH